MESQRVGHNWATFSFTFCVQFSSVAQLCPTLSDSMNCRMPGFPVLHHPPQFAQTHIHWVSDAIQYLILYRSLLLLPTVFPSIRVFSRQLTLCIRWPNYWSFEFFGFISIYPLNNLVKNLPAMQETWVRTLGWENPLEKERVPTPVFWPGEFHELYSPWSHKELDTAEWLSLSLVS